MRKLFLVIAAGAFSIFATAQKNESAEKTPLTAYVGVLAGGCVDNPFSFMGGVEKKMNTHLTLSADLHFWNTGYECFCDSMYSQGKFKSFTPSVKLTYSTGKKEGMGFVVGVGVGYMFAKDRGTEQPYSYDVATNTNIVNDKALTKGNWDFNSISPSFSLGVGFRVLKIPVTFQSVYYFANTTEGWMATAGGAGFKIGLRRIK